MIRFFTLALTLIVLSPLAYAETRTGTLQRETYVYRQADVGSETLGHLANGKQVKVNFPDQNGWYSINFSKPVKGATVGYIQALDVQVDGPSIGDQVNSGTDRARKNIRRYLKPKSSWVDIGYTMHMTSPSDVQAAIGEAVAGVSVPEYSLTFGHFTSPVFAVEFRGFYYSVNKTTVTNAGGSYSAKGYGLTAGGDFAFVKKDTFNLGFGAGLGASMNDAGNVTSKFVFDTSSVLAFPLYLKLFAKVFFGSVGLSAEAGYQIFSLSQIPFSPPAATTQDTQTLANWAMSGLFIHGGLAFQF